MTASEILVQKGIRSTAFRENVLAILLREGAPLSHAQLTALLPAETDRVTLYRTLELFSREGVVHQVQGPDGAWRFCAHDTSSTRCPGNHPHFLCLSCRRMICLADQPVQRVDVPEGLTVEGKQLVVYGRCSECGAEHGDPTTQDER